MKNFKHKKSLGQNFLHDDKILDKIVDMVHVTKNDLIIEIGPGHGALTKRLKEFNANLLCYEIDEETNRILSCLIDDKTKIIFNDFLKADIYEDINGIEYDNLYIFGNIPYYITTSIIKKICDLRLPIKEVILMVQKEVADRFVALPGSREYKEISVILNYYFEISKLFEVNKKSFIPIPKVDSAVILLKSRLKRFKVINENHFFKLIHDSFGQKRKNIKNNLKGYDIKILEEVLENNDLSLSSRAEEMSVEVFVLLSNALFSQNS